MSRIFIFYFFLISMFVSTAQKSINDYKYVIVPEEYDFLREKDQYQLNSLTKFLFNKYGFNAIIQGEDFPDDLTNNGCKGLRADVKEKSGAFQTKFTVILKDCNDKVVFSSIEGKSRAKDYKEAYHEALRKAFLSIKMLNYKYSGDKEEPLKDAMIKKPQAVQQAELKETASQTSSEETYITYLLNDQIFVFKKQDFGYEIFKKENKELMIGKAFRSSNKVSYLIHAADLSGLGFFDGYGNFVLERVNPVTNKLIIDVLARQ